ncbi:MAG: hypothetical protein ACYCZB_18150 [Acidiphilium sp.]
MALTAGFNLSRRGARAGRSDFGYPVAPGVAIWRGGIMGLNAAGQLQPVQTAATVAFAGVATQDYNNAGSANAGPTVVASRECYALTVPAATAADIGTPVYATDDATLTLTAPTTGFVGAIGTLVGIEGGQTYVLIAGA